MPDSGFLLCLLSITQGEGTVFRLILQIRNLGIVKERLLTQDHRVSRGIARLGLCLNTGPPVIPIHRDYTAHFSS